MPKNIKGGNKAKKGKNSSLRAFTRKLELPDDSGYQYHGLVTNHYGATTDIMYVDTRFSANDPNSRLKKVVGYVRGSIKKRCRLKPNDIVIIAIREYQENKVDIIHKYNEEEIKLMKKRNYFNNDFISMINASNSGINLKQADVSEITQQNIDYIQFEDEYASQSEDELAEI